MAKAGQGNLAGRLSRMSKALPKGGSALSFAQGS